MPDIDLRLDRDVVVLSAPIESALASSGVADGDFELALLVEPDTVEEAYHRSLLAGATCLVTPTSALSRAQLAQHRLEDKAQALADAAFEPLAALRAQAMQPQHILVEIGPCGLPLDVASTASLKEHRAQYAEVAALFSGQTFDGFLLSGFRRLGALKPAIEALQALHPEKPLFVEVDVDAAGRLIDGFEDLDDLAAFAASNEIAVIGLRVVDDASNPWPTSIELASDLRDRHRGPLLVSLPILDDAGDLDDLIETAESLRLAGVQFVRAVGADATALQTAALAGAIGGMPVVTRVSTESGADVSRATTDPGEELAAVAADAGVDLARFITDDERDSSRSSTDDASDDIPFKPIPDDLIARFAARVDEALKNL